MRWFFYNVLFAVGYVCMLPHFLIRMFRRGGYRARFMDRFGYYPDDVLKRLKDLQGRAVWIHAVSVGEVYVAGQMMRALRAQNPDIRFVLSTTSSTGWQEAKKQVLPQDQLIYHPIDFLPCVYRALQAVRPRCLILTESEIWPNFIRSCKQRGIPIFLINARVSDRSAPRYKLARFWFGPVLRCFSQIFAQSNLDRKRLLDAGADPEHVSVTGSFKFDVAKRAPEKERAVQDFLRSTGLRPDDLVLLGGSTWPGEDAALIRIYQNLRKKFPQLRLVLVPRHFEKAPAVEAEIRKAGLICIRKSHCVSPLSKEEILAAREGNAVWLGDTTGELMGFYGNAQIAFVGKSLCEHGAQNMIEPCLCGAATLVGPFAENFRPVMEDLLESQALIQVPDEETLEQEIERLLEDPKELSALGNRAAEAVESRGGVVARCAKDLYGVWATTSSASQHLAPAPLDGRSIFSCIWVFAAQLFLGMLVSALLRAEDMMGGRIFLVLFSCALTVLASFVLGAVLSDWSLRKVRRPSCFLSILFLLTALFCTYLLGHLDATAMNWQRLLVDGTRTPSLLYGLLISTAMTFYVLPGIFSGCAAQMLEQNRFDPMLRESFRPLVCFFFITLLPLVLGFCLGGSVVLPLLGGILPTLRSLFLLFCLLAVCAACTAWRGRGIFHWKHLLYILAVFLITFGLVYSSKSVHPKTTYLSAGGFSRFIHRDSGFAAGRPLIEFSNAHHDLAFFWDRDYQFVFTQDGRPVLFGNRFQPPRTLSAYLPLLFRPKAGRVCLLGEEAGLYLPFYQRAGVPDLAYLDADELCVKEALVADQFIEDVDSDRVQLPKSLTALDPDKPYDILFLAQEPVWMRGTALNYTKGRMRKCADALAEDGIVAMHLDTRALSTARFVMISRNFLSVFPYAQFWMTGRYDWMLLGAKKPLTASISQMLRFFEKEEVSRDFTRAGILSLPEIFPSLLADEEGMSPWLERSPAERACQSAFHLGRLMLQDEDRKLFSPSQVEGLRQRRLSWLKQDKLDLSLFMPIRSRSEHLMDTRSLSVLALSNLEAHGSEQGLQALRDVAKMFPRDILVRHFLESLELEARRRIQLSEFAGAVKCYQKLLAFNPNMGLAHYGLGFCARATGDSRTAFDHFVRAINCAPYQTDYRMELAQVAGSLGDYEEAERQYQVVLRSEPDNPEALYRYAKSLSSKNRPEQDYKKAIPLAEKACDLTHWRVQEYAYGLADLYMDSGRVMEGMGLRRRIKEQFSKR